MFIVILPKHYHDCSVSKINMKKLSFLLIFAPAIINSEIKAPLQKIGYTSAHNDSFISSLLEAASYDSFKAAGYATSITSTKISGVQAVNFINGENKFVFYKSKYNTFIKSFSVNKSEAVLNKVLPIGATKQEMLNKLRIVRSLDVLKISDLEGGAVTTLYFSNNRLQKAVFNATVD